MTAANRVTVAAVPPRETASTIRPSSHGPARPNAAAAQKNAVVVDTPPR